MELSVGQSRNGTFAAARSANDRIRLLTIPKAGRPTPAAAFDTAPAWQVAGPQTVRAFSAVCYYFGREVHERQNVPVGLVNASWGGTAIEPWIGESGLRSIGGLRRAPRPAATLRARRGRGQPGPRADVGRLVAGPWRSRRRTVEAGRRRPVDRRAGAAELEDLGRARTGEPRRHGVVPPRVPPDARAGRAAGHAGARRDRRGRPDLGERPRHPQHLRLGHRRGPTACPPGRCAPATTSWS